MYLVVGSRGHRVRRQEMRCEGYCGAMRSAPWTERPRLMTAIHMRNTVTLRSMTKYRFVGSDQALNGLNFIVLIEAV